MKKYILLVFLCCIVFNVDSILSYFEFLLNLVKIEAQLSLVGGTMGLLTGFSIISAIEIINFFLRLTF